MYLHVICEDENTCRMDMFGRSLILCRYSKDTHLGISDNTGSIYTPVALMNNYTAKLKYEIHITLSTTGIISNSILVYDFIAW